jgi:enoyl-CoA hydratase
MSGTYRNLIVTLEGPLTVILVNRPEVRNALDRATVDELHAALEDIRARKGLVFILAGAGDKAFVSGADVNAIRERRRDDALAGINSRLMSTVESHDAISIAAISGYALGGGLELALACDLRIAGENAVFGLPETGLGIIPGAGATQRLPRIVGLGRAKEMVLGGVRWTAAEAKQAGLVLDVAPPAGLLTAARALAARVLERAPLALRLAKQALNASSQMGLAAGLRHESALQGLTFESRDKLEGTSAFLEKRKPIFTGE